MAIRRARAGDAARIHEIATHSLQASYALSPEDIDTIVGAIFSDEALGDTFDDETTAVYVAESSTKDGSRVDGFVDVALDTHVVRWLHVHPDARGEGIGTALLEHARDTLDGDDHPFTVYHLEAGTEGREFFDRFGLVNTTRATLEFDDESYPQRVYQPAHGDPGSVPTRVTVEGELLTVAVEQPVSGTEAPFYPISHGGTDPYGYLCGNCHGTDVAADTLERLECTDCNNTHLADSWDSAYL